MFLYSYNSADNEYSYPHNNMDEEEVRVYKEKRARYLQKVTGETTVATPDDYDDVILYEKMTRCYYVCELFYLHYSCNFLILIDSG